MNCTTCPSYNRGKGSRACLTCDKYGDVLPKYKPPPPTSHISYIILDQAAAPEDVKSIVDALRMIEDDVSATMFLQSTILGMTHEEIAQYYQTFSRPSVTRKINKAMNIVKKILHN